MSALFHRRSPNSGIQQNQGHLFIKNLLCVTMSNLCFLLHLISGTQTSARMGPVLLCLLVLPKACKKDLALVLASTCCWSCFHRRGAICPHLQPQRLSLPNAPKGSPNMGSVTLRFFFSSALKSVPLKFIAGICTRFFLLSMLFFMLAAPPPQLPPFVISVRKQALIVSGPKLQPELLQPGPITGLINSRAARIPRSSRGRAGLLPKEAALSGLFWERCRSTPSPGLPPALSPFPLALVGQRETISSFHRGSMAGRLMNVSPAQRPACQKCPQCIQWSPRWAVSGTIAGNKRRRAAQSGSQQQLRL